MMPLGPNASSEGRETVTATPTFTITPSPTLNPSSNELVGPVVAAPNISKDGDPIHFKATLGRVAQVRLMLFSMSGERVYEKDFLGASGENVFTWTLGDLNGSPVASGLYFYVLEADDGDARTNKIGKVVVLH